VYIMIQQLVEVESGGSRRDVKLSMSIRQISHAAMKMHILYVIGDEVMVVLRRPVIMSGSPQDVIEFSPNLAYKSSTLVKCEDNVAYSIGSPGQPQVRTLYVCVCVCVCVCSVRVHVSLDIEQRNTSLFM
jgi:hypothetical protein